MEIGLNIVLIYFAIKYKSDAHKIFESLESKKTIPIEEIRLVCDLVSQDKIQAITLADEDYPELLKSQPLPPFVIFYNCEINQTNREQIIEKINNEIEILELEDDELAIAKYMESISKLPYSIEILYSTSIRYIN